MPGTAVLLDPMRPLQLLTPIVFSLQCYAVNTIRSTSSFQEYIEERRSIDQRLTRLEHGARQSRLAMEADGPANTKTRECTEGAATAVQAMHGDSCTAQKVQDGPKTSISFGVKAQPPDLPCREDVLVEDSAAAPKSCLPSLEMRSTIAAGGLVSTGKPSTATETNFNPPHLRFYSTEKTDSEANSKETDLRTSTTYVSYVFFAGYRSVFFVPNRQTQTKAPL